ncbi:4-diphosphocytidyl-2C-methyl-D-erythritol synthase [Virgisporangium aliadipatigenens]|uniref:4-diphosphocytidyl-2C-methyl-D-erythritol synthase n=1 Tax=Virgisporangium aliadipatigenens TaxID=741659 RepID=A0A8J3YW87_9ACTN|nr:nucleotidyltransferase family protein [Virgisporangium aliadipatigenens]GIJ51693.1 4-diphosphocytidyl-2C-methyl-D-erythritol synthase [Virgisporangium aliadipatigenens]
MDGMAAGLLLAAGGGTRYGTPKALVERDGRLLVETALETLDECRPQVVVLGAAAEKVVRRAYLGEALVVVNQQWTSGVASSLRAGLEALIPTAAEAVVVMLVDTPGITIEAVRRIAAFECPQALVSATYGGEPGHPVLLGRDHWGPIIAEAHGDEGARGYLRRHPRLVRHVPCDDIADGTDLDSPADALVPFQTF